MENMTLMKTCNFNNLREHENDCDDDVDDDMVR